MSSMFIISSHGKANFASKTTIPNDTSVHFYTPFGKEMPNQQGFQIQTALSRGTQRQSNPVALWNTGQQTPDIALTGDMHLFKSGILQTDGHGNNTVILALGNNKLITLTYALSLIRQHQPQGHIDVHCLFCLTP